MLNHSVEERLKWLHKDNVRIVDAGQPLVVEEKEKDGEALLTCYASNPLFAFLKLDSNRLKYINCGQTKCADTIIFEKVSDDCWNLHVIEFKRSVNANKWDGIKKQFHGGILQATACMGVLGIQNIAEIKCYTAFRNDKLQPQENVDPVMLKMGVGVLNPNSAIDWITDKINFDAISLKEIPHKKITLDEETGEGKHELN